MAAPLEKRFWAKVTKTDGCWEWTGAKGNGGVGIVSVQGRLEKAHRVAWQLSVGVVPPGERVLHRCGNAGCVRPDHLYLSGEKDIPKVSRRPRGTGHVATRAGRVRIRASAGFDPVTGKRRQVSKTLRAGATRREVEEEAARLRAEVADGLHETTSRTVGELLDRWWAMKQHEIAGTTANNYGSSLRYLERLRPVPLRKLTTEMIESHYHGLRRAGAVRDGEGLAKSSVKNVHCVLNGALKMGKRWGWLRTNPAADIEIAADEARRQVRISPVQIRELADRAREIEGEAFALLIRLVAVAGPRRGELHALRFSDVDWDRNRVEIVRNYVKVRDGWVEKPTTKTGRSRWVDLDDTTMRMLRAQQLRLTEIGELLEVPLEEDAFVFSDDGHRPWNPNTSLRRFQALCGLVGLPPETRMHDLRHFMVTTLFENKVPAKQITGRSGHARTSTAVDIYYGAAESQRGAAKVMGRVLDGTTTRQPRQGPNRKRLR